MSWAPRWNKVVLRFESDLVQSNPPSDELQTRGHSQCLQANKSWKVVTGSTLNPGLHPWGRGPSDWWHLSAIMLQYLECFIKICMWNSWRRSSGAMTRGGKKLTCTCSSTCDSCTVERDRWPEKKNWILKAGERKLAIVAGWWNQTSPWQLGIATCNRSAAKMEPWVHLFTKPIQNLRGAARPVHSASKF